MAHVRIQTAVVDGKAAPRYQLMRAIRDFTPVRIVDFGGFEIPLLVERGHLFLEELSRLDIPLIFHATIPTPQCREQAMECASCTSDTLYHGASRPKGPWDCPRLLHARMVQLGYARAA
eukprot:scaffold318185_cov39-Tisochrysis_lutea.AAC.4